jgi:hypothetical protein
MRVLVCLLALLCGCSTSGVRCDAHLRPINPPGAGGTAGAGRTSGPAQPPPARRTP